MVNERVRGDQEKRALHPPAFWLKKGRNIYVLANPGKSRMSRINTYVYASTDNLSRAICLEGCRYDVVRRMALEMNFKEVGEHDVWNIIWTDTPISLEKALEMRRFQVRKLSQCPKPILKSIPFLSNNRIHFTITAHQDAHSIFWGSHSPLQKANHFPGMNEICRKDRLARNLNRMKRSFPNEYSFFPKTWSLPAE